MASKRIVITLLVVAGLVLSACAGTLTADRPEVPEVALARSQVASDPWSADPTVTARIGTNTPGATAITVSKARFVDDGAAHVVLSRDDKFPDALAGTPLVGEGPLLLTPSASLAPSVRAELDRVLPDGGTVYLLGGTAALSATVEDELVAAGYDVRRLGGASRIETAVAIATEVAARYPTGAGTVLIARAFGTPDNPTAAWADSVTGGGYAASARLPVVLSDTGALSGPAATFLQGRSRAILLGGTAALAEQVATDAGGIVGRVDRAAGAGRDATAVKIMTNLWRVTAPDRILVVNGYSDVGWAFGLPAAGLAADFDAPMLPVAVDVLPQATAAAVTSSRALDTLAVGGSAVIGDAVIAAVEARDGDEAAVATAADGRPPAVPHVGDGIPLRVVLVDGALTVGADTPITVGVPVPAADVAGPWAVTGPDGAVPTQADEQVRLGDGLSWLLVDFVAPAGSSTADWRLVRATPPTAAPTVRVTTSGDDVVIDTGDHTWTVPATTDLLGRVTGPTSTVLDGAGFTGVATADAELTVLDDGPVRAAVELRAPAAVRGLDLVARLHFWAGQPHVRVRITLTNHQPCLTYDQAGGADNGPDDYEEGHEPACNGLRSANRITFDDLSWGVDLATSGGGTTVQYQDSSGTDAWDTYVDRGPRMQSGVSFRGYRTIRDGTIVDQGDVAPGTLAAGSTAALTIPWMRELFPKALRDLGTRLEAGLFPGEYAIDHVLRAGEQKTHDVWVSVGTSAAPASQAYAAPSQAWLAATEAFGPIPGGAIGATGAPAAYDEYLQAQLDEAYWERDECQSDEEATFGCGRSLPDAQIRYDYFGWTDFGDLPTDFEGPMSPYNLKYDANLGFLLQAVRSGDPVWWEWAHSSSLHYADIDILHAPVRGADADRIWWEGGAFGHSYHNEVGLANPHRNYQNPHPDTTWGAAGMAAWSLLSGDEVTAEATVELADNVLWRFRNTADDACAVRAWGGGNGEGYGLAGEPGDARPVANAVRIWLAAWKLTGDRAYLDAIDGAVDWFDCDREAAAECPGWRTSLLGRGLGEYWRAAGQAGLDTGDAAATVVDLAGILEGALRTEGDRSWIVNCDGFEEINAWMLGAADLFAHAAGASGDQRWLDVGRRSFNVGATDPYYPGDGVQYHSAKELVNVVDDGLAYLAFAPE